MNKWIASDISRSLAAGLASEYNKKNLPCIEIPCGLAGGSLQYVLAEDKLTELISADPGIAK